MNSYVSSVIEYVKKKYAYEPEFVQTVEEVFSSISPVVDKHPEYEQAKLLERLVEPDRSVSFRVVWTDDNGKVNVNTGYRVQFNNAIGPYKGGLRFHPSVYSGVMKFLGFEQIFKNSLTGLPIGGAKGGSDFNPVGKSDSEIMRFCQAFMTELYRYIGPDVDVPAGDIGVGAREVGYLYGQYKRIKGTFENGVITGKGLSFGGSILRPEATGYGAVYYLNEVLNHFGDDIKGKVVAVSGFGNVAWGVIKKLAALGAKPVTISDMYGFAYDPSGIITDEKISYLLELRAKKDGRAEEYAKKFGCQYFPNQKPWGIKCDIVMPCATQNEVNLDDAKRIVDAGVPYYIEVANLPTTAEAIEYLKANCKVVAPSKAVNAGGVATSALEMSQDSMRYSWSSEEVDAKLHGIMKNIYDNSVKAAEEYGFGYDLIAGANIAGFIKVANAMMAQGLY